MNEPTLVIGATGDLGGRIVKELRRQDKVVRALVREGSDASNLEQLGVEIVRGDLLDRDSLESAMSGAGAAVTTAQGYAKRRKGDSLEAVDSQGNRNLVDAAAAMNLPRLVFTSILTCDQARAVPHFWQKKLIEDYAEQKGISFVALRPGAFLGGGATYLLNGLHKGRMSSIGSADVAWTYVHPDDAARFAVSAISDPRVVGQRIDIGSDRPVSINELAELFAQQLGRGVKVRTIPLRPLLAVARLMKPISPMMYDGMAMLQYFQQGSYVANIARQTELFGTPPSIEEVVRRAIDEAGLR